MQPVRNTTEPPLEADCVIVHLQVAHSARRNVQYYLPVAGETGRNLNPWMLDVDEQVRRALVVHDPLI